VGHRASRSELSAAEWQDLEDAPFQLPRRPLGVPGQTATDLVRLALQEHLRQTQDLAIRLERALGALEAPNRSRAMTG